MILECKSRKPARNVQRRDDKLVHTMGRSGLFLHTQYLLCINFATAFWTIFRTVLGTFWNYWYVGFWPWVWSTSPCSVHGSWQAILKVTPMEQRERELTQYWKIFTTSSFIFHQQTSLGAPSILTGTWLSYSCQLMLTCLSIEVSPPSFFAPKNLS